TRRVADDPGDAVAVPAVYGQRVDRPAAPQDGRVAPARGQGPGLGQGAAVGRVEQLGLDCGGEGRQGARAAQGGDLRGVLELQQLDRPLDVGQPTATQLEVPAGVGAL